MILHIHQLHAVEELSFDLDGAACGFPPEAGKLRAPIHIEARVRKIQAEITVEGRISTVVEMACVRCLKPHQEILTDEFDVVYHPQPANISVTDEVELSVADLAVMYYTGDTISLAEVIREQILLMLPVQPLCDPHCAGLCPSCGKNLNLGSCGCVTQTVDSRLAVLAGLLPQESN
jgi:uncharacterized protein